MVATARLSATWRRHGWLLAGLLALVVLSALALLGPERAGSLGASVAAGPMRHIAPDTVQRVRISQGARTVEFERSATRWQRGGAPISDADVARLEAALRLLHNTPPERRFEAAKADFGLAAPSLTVELTGVSGAALAIEFGAANPLGLARYARVSHGPEAGVVLMPGDVHDSWLALLRDDGG